MKLIELSEVRDGEAIVGIKTGSLPLLYNGECPRLSHWMLMLIDIILCKHCFEIKKTVNRHRTRFSVAGLKQLVIRVAGHWKGVIGSFFLSRYCYFFVIWPTHHL